MPKTKNVPDKQVQSELVSSKDYVSTLAELKKQIRESQVRAISSANRELVKLYWSIGKTIVEKQEKSGWGAKIIETLAKDIQIEFPGIEGFSRTNIFRMKAFYQEYKLVPPLVGQIEEIEHLGVLTQIPWSHNQMQWVELKRLQELGITHIVTQNSQSVDDDGALPLDGDIDEEGSDMVIPNPSSFCIGIRKADIHDSDRLKCYGGPSVTHNGPLPQKVSDLVEAEIQAFAAAP